MQLVLFRHGIAVDRADPACPPDADRPLTERGRRRARQAARGLATLGIDVDWILSSPLLRALETARLAADALGRAQRDVRQTLALAPSADPDVLLAEVLALGGRGALCVGHAPHLDAVLAAALAPGAAPFTSLKKAGAACLEMGPAGSDLSAALVWLADAQMLRRMGRFG